MNGWPTLNGKPPEGSGSPHLPSLFRAFRAASNKKDLDKQIKCIKEL